MKLIKINDEYYNLEALVVARTDEESATIEFQGKNFVEMPIEEWNALLRNSGVVIEIQSASTVQGII